MVQGKPWLLISWSCNEIENDIEAWYVMDCELNTDMSLTV